MPLNSLCPYAGRFPRRFPIVALLGILVLGLPLRGQENPSGVPIFYLVLVLEKSGPATIVHASLPVIPHTLEGLPLGLFEEGRQEILGSGRGVAVSVIDAGGHPLFFRIYPLMGSIRGEFHGEPQPDGGWSIEDVDFALAEALSVVRVPALPDSRVVIETATGTLAVDSFDLVHSASQAERWRTRDAEPLRTGLSVSSESESGDNRVDLLIMGDGYTQAEQQKFFSDATFFEQELFAITPYSEYRNYVRVTKLFVASQQSGADHPPFDPSCVGDDPSCCADAEAQTDPLAGTYVNTALNSRYCAFNTHRLLVPDTVAVLTAADEVPNWDQIVVLVNDTTYGGSGSASLRLSTSSLNSFAVDIVRHEYGHTFTDLADEYDTANPGFPACSDINGPLCEANVTDETNISLLKWSPWVPGGVPIPTPEGESQYQDVVGLFEGARYLTSGMYRPRDVDCLMHILEKPFGEVCRQEYVLRLYTGGWGSAPLSGIRTIEPGSPRPEQASFRKCSGSLRFSVMPLQPLSGPEADIQWLIEGVIVSGAKEPSFTYSSTAPASETIAVRVKDTTPFVHPDMENGELTSAHAWSVDTVSLPSSVTVESQNVVQAENYEACDTITAGPAVEVKNGGDLNLQAGRRVVLRDGFRVESGGSLTVIVDSVFPN